MKAFLSVKTQPILCTYTLLTRGYYVKTKCIFILLCCCVNVKHMTVIICQWRYLKHLSLAPGGKHSLGIWVEVKVLMEEALKFMEALLPNEKTPSRHWSPTACCGSQSSAHPHSWTVYSQVYDVMLKRDVLPLSFSVYSSTTDCSKSWGCMRRISPEFLGIHIL